MKRVKTVRLLTALVVTAVMLLVSACGMGVKVPDSPPGDPPGDDEVHVFYFEDFSEYELGTQPEGWTIRNGDEGEFGSVEIVEDTELESQRALKIFANLVSGTSQNFTVGGPQWTTVSADVTTIGYEYKVRVVDSRGINAYITKSSSHKVVTGVGGGKLIYSDGSWKDLDELPEGWNTVRIIANRVSKTADIYLNDVLVGESTQLRNETDSWTNAQAYFLIATSATETKEVYFGDLKAWIIE